MADIFISYKSERRPAARHLAKVLGCYGFDVWYDYGLVPGHDFEPTIMAEIEKAKVVLVLWCAMSARSDWVQKEARAARLTSKFLPCRVESCTLPDEFSGADTINLSEWDASPRSHLLDRLLDELGHRTGIEPASRISSLREVEEDWRGYGAPALSQFALGRALGPDVVKENVVRAPSILGAPPSGITSNLKQHWESALSGQSIALVNIGRAYFYGNDGLPKDQAAAVRCFRAAADMGCALGQAHFGVAHYYGEGGLPKNEREAVRLWRLSADQGDAKGQMHLGVAYRSGEGGLPVNEAEGVRYYKMAAAQGNSQAQSNLGHLYREGLAGLQKNDIEAARLFTLSANQGNASGQVNLGRMHFFGAGVRKDLRRAAELYRLAADQGDARAQCNLGAMYEDGEGLPRDRHEAVRLYKVSAQKGDDLAQRNLIRLGETW